MATNSQRLKGRNGALSTLNAAIGGLNLVKQISNDTSAKVVFGSVSRLLTTIRDSMPNDKDYVDLGLCCADICRALDRGMNGKRLDDLPQFVRETINRLTTIVAEIQKRVIKQSQRRTVSRLLRAKNHRDAIATWKLELNRILHVFSAELATNTELTANTGTTANTRVATNTGIATDTVQAPTVSNIYDDMSRIRREISCLVRSVQSSAAGESPPPPPRACFGREWFIEKIVGLAETLTPIALIGSGGIGKSSIALTALHHDRIKQRFGDNRRFICCDQFPASRANFLRRLSKAIGADSENPEDLTPLRPYLTSKETLIVLDNAEFILDPQGAGGQGINVVVQELSQFSNICLCITSRITTVPPDCETLEIPTLTMEAARDAFHRIYKYGGQADSINQILEQLDFHPLSATLLATLAHRNKWDNNRLAREWEQRQTGVLQTGYYKSISHMIEASLSSPMFEGLGPDARGLLEVVAFFPQGIGENNLDWLFPAISNRTTIFDTFCVLSLTYRDNGFITLLAPLRDYFRPQDPMQSSFLCETKDHYFTRMTIDFNRNDPVFRESRWVTVEDMNIEHLLDVFTSADADTNEVWIASANFICHLYWHKPRPTVLRQKIQDLPDGHPSKSGCLIELARLLYSLGNHAERKQLLDHALKLEREGGDDDWVAAILSTLSDANRMLGLHNEGIKQVKEALKIYQRRSSTVEQARCLSDLAWLLYGSGQFDEAKETISQAIDLIPEKGHEFLACESQRLLGEIYHSKGERDKGIHHLEAALAIASPFDWHDQLFWIHHSLVVLFLDQRQFDSAQIRIEQAKLHAVENLYYLGRAMELQAKVWHQQGRLEEAMSEALHAFEAYEKLGVKEVSEACRTLLQEIERATNRQSAPVNLDTAAHSSPSGTIA